MHEDGAVAQAPQLGTQIGLLLPHVHVEGNRTLWEEGHGVARQKLVLRVGGGAAEHGGVGRAPDGVLGEAVEEGQGVLVGLQVKNLRQVGEGLVHDNDEVHRRFRPGGVRIALPLLLRLQPDRGQGLLRVILRLLHRAVPQAHREVEDEAIAPCGPQGGLDLHLPEEVGLEENRQVDGGENGHREDGLPVGTLPSRALGHLPKQQQEEGQHQQAPELDDIGGVIVVPRHVGGGLEGEEVAREDGAAPEVDDVPVGQAHEGKEPGGEPSRQPHPAGDQVEHAGKHVIPHQVQADLEGGELLPDQVVVVHLLHQHESEQRADDEGGPAAPGGGLISQCHAQR